MAKDETQIEEKEQENHIKGFHLVNKDRLERAIYGTLGREGLLAGGVGEDASDDAVLAEYDRLGGLIKKGENKVKLGSFYDFKNKKARATPVIVFEFRDTDGVQIDIPEGEAIPLKVKAAEIIREKKRTGKTAKAVEEEEEE